METQLHVCRFCGADLGKATVLDQCDVCEAWVCPDCGCVRFDEEAHGMVCARCYRAIHHPVVASSEPTQVTDA